MRPYYQQINPTFGEWTWNQNPSDQLLSSQLAYLHYLNAHWINEIIEFRQGFTRVSIVWKSPEKQDQFIREIEGLELIPVPLTSKVWQVPVCYDPMFGDDLVQLAEEKKISPSKIIELHTTPLYRIHFYGFLPGFFYLNGLDPLLHTPRKSMPGASVQPGSVALGGSQTGIYPKESPGGWHILGRTPLSLFDRQKQPPVWAKPGERIQFIPIDAQQYHDWKPIQPQFVEQ